MEFKSMLCEEKLKAACISNEWYTKGNSKQYEAMFRAAQDVTESGIINTAENIKEHSDTGYTITEIASVIYRTCIIRWVED